MQKEEARKVYRQKRRELAEAEFARLNERLSDNFFGALDLTSVNVLHTFLPIASQKEVDTWRIIRRIRNEFPHVRIAVPRVNDQSAVIESYLFEREDQLEVNTWGIPEPTSGMPVANEKIDLILTPLLAVDLRGNRVGYGRGFYDRFLSNVAAQKIGLSLFPPVDRIEGMNAMDVPIDRVVTPEGVIDFHRKA